MPGTPSSIATTFDAFPMAKAGKARKALKVGIVSSFIGGMISGIILVLVAPQVAKIALSFGPYEYFFIAVFGLTIITSIGAKSRLKAVLSAVLGLLVALFGMDPVDGVPRFTFGLPWLEKGFSLIPTLLGLFVFPQLFAEIKNLSEKYIFKQEGKDQDASFSLGEMVRHWANFVRSSLIGTGLGILPGVGGAIANFVCYDQAQKASRTPEKFGTGTEEGIIASETGNNATTGGALVPMLTLGIPGDAVTAIILGGLMIHGIQPGPLLFVEQVDLVYGIFAAFFIANVVMILIQYFLGVRLFTMALQIPKSILIPIVIMMCVAGVYAIDYQISDVWVLFFFGLVGYVMRKYQYPIPATVLGVILGPHSGEESAAGLDAQRRERAALFHPPHLPDHNRADHIFPVHLPAPGTQSKKGQGIGGLIRENELLRDQRRGICGKRLLSPASGVVLDPRQKSRPPWAQP